MKKIIAIVWLFLTASTAAAAASDADFLAARDAYIRDKQARLDVYATRLHGHVLEPYVAYWQLLLRLQAADADIEALSASARGFLTRHRGTLLADRLRAEWLRRLGEAGQWDVFRVEYPNLVQRENDLVCYSLRARLRFDDATAIEEARRFWLTGNDLADSCTPLFDGLIASGSIPVDDLWRRLRLALEAGNNTLAGHVSQQLPPGDQIDQRTLQAVVAQPQRYLERTAHAFDQRASRELAIAALIRVARQQPDDAVGVWRSYAQHFSAEDRTYVWSQIALHAARKHHPDAVRWFDEAGTASLSDFHLGWRARAALREQNWPAVKDSIDRMSLPEQNEPAWRYWKARAWKVLGGDNGKLEANLLFAGLSGEHHFYGVLSSEELGRRNAIPPETFKPDKATLAAVQRLPGIQRALELYRLDLRTEAIREWIWAVRDLGDAELLAVSEIARSHGLYDRAINAADKTVRKHDFSLRYLTPYRNNMERRTREAELDQAWVYGLIRQESRFIADARSSAGAAGLMQVMPATARWVAKRTGIKTYRSSHISQVDTNLMLGTQYLAYVLETLDSSAVLATAAYNAGPARAQAWRNEAVMESAIYIETIPFSETRDYVKKVMTNAWYYAQLLGQPAASLKDRIGVIPSHVGEVELLEARLLPPISPTISEDDRAAPPLAEGVATIDKGDLAETEAAPAATFADGAKEDAEQSRVQ